jgi:hypothetical protein
MEIENSSAHDAHLNLQDRLKEFNQEFNIFKKNLDRKFEQFKEMSMMQIKKPVHKEGNGMEVESTGLSMTPKNSVGKGKNEVSGFAICLRFLRVREGWAMPEANLSRNLRRFGFGFWFWLAREI